MIKLGDTDIAISKICVGTWAWGSSIIWGYGKDYHEADLLSVYQESLRAGVNFFDTAEIYGMGNSEKILGRCIPEMPAETAAVITTKFMPYPWRFGGNELRKALIKSLKRLGLEKVELYQIHQPGNVAKWVNAIADVYQDGLISAVGVSNYNTENLKRTYDILERRGIKLASNQMQLSLLYRKHELSGLLKLCQELNVTFLAYTPIAQGVLTGKYTPQNPPRGLLRSRRYGKAMLQRVQPLLTVMAEISEGKEDQTVAQVAINWVISKGAVPIVGAKNLKQAKENIGALNWQLSDEDIARLDEAAELVSG